MVEKTKDESIMIPLKFFEELVNNAARYSYIRNHADDVDDAVMSICLPEELDEYIDRRWLEQFPQMVDENVGL